MSLFTKQGHFVVLRDSKGRVISKVMEGTTPRETFRSILRKLSNDGFDYAQALDGIARGTPVVVELPDGRQSEPQVAPIGVRVEALKFLWEQLHGKAVDQTKVVEAAHAADELARFKSMSERELEEFVRRTGGETDAEVEEGGDG